MSSDLEVRSSSLCLSPILGTLGNSLYQSKSISSAIEWLGKESACNAGDPGPIPGWADPLEKGMATHTSILAWRISWTEDPGGLQSVRSERVGYKSGTNTFTFRMVRVIKLFLWATSIPNILRVPFFPCW